MLHVTKSKQQGERERERERERKRRERSFNTERTDAWTGVQPS